MAYKIFISYSQKNISAARALAGLLSQIKHARVFFAEESLPPGEAIPHNIKRRIRDADLFVLLWSGHSKKSAWVAQELGLAIAERVRVLPVVLTRDFNAPALISHVKAVHAFSNRAKAFEAVAAHVARWSASKARRERRGGAGYSASPSRPGGGSGAPVLANYTVLMRGPDGTLKPADSLFESPKKSLVERILEKLY